MNADVKLDFSRVPHGEPVTLRLMVTLRPDARRREAPRRALNVAVVLDRSGSMSGRKLEDVKDAARTLYRALGPADTFSLAAFDDKVYAVVPPGTIAELGQSVDRAIDSLQAGGQTDLCGGYEQGCRFAVKAACAERTSRVLLLTDGLANHGVVEPPQIARVVDRYRSLGIGTSTVGVGAGYNEELLGLMAERGGGATYFLRSAAEAALVFSEELGDLFSIDAADIAVRFVPASVDVRATQLNTYAIDGDGAWRMGDLFGTQPRHLVLEVAAGPFAPVAEGKAALGTIEVRWRRATDAGFEPASVSLPVEVTLGPKESMGGLRPDREVVLQAAFLVAARAIEKALGLADEQKFEQAAGVLADTATHLDSFALGDPGLDGVIADLRDRAARMQQEREQFYSSMERKSMYTRHQHLSKNLHGKLSSMESRHGRQRPLDAGAHGVPRTFPCYLVNGHLLVEMGEDRVLLDTGSPVSIGGQSPFELLGRENILQTSYQGATIDSLGSLVGTRITVLLGADILSRYDMRIDLDAGTVQFSSSELRLGAEPLPVGFFQGVPIVEARMDGAAERFFFDTGAKLSYLHSSRVQGLPPVGTDRDFFPGFGEFEVKVVERDIALVNLRRRLRFATLPRLLEMSLLLAGVTGILGSALCEGSPVVYAPRRGLLSIG